MDFSSMTVWTFVIQIGIVFAALLFANFLRQHSPVVKNSLMPVAVLAGFLVLALKYICRGFGFDFINNNLYETIVYHAIALGFIAMTLRTTDDAKEDAVKFTGLRSGAIIVSSYLVQGIVGLAVTIGLALTVMPNLFPAAGLLLPMGFGQGPGQANNVGTTYEMAGLAGGRSFGLAIAACGYVIACTIGVVILNVLRYRGKLTPRGEARAEEVSVSYFQGEDELPVSDSIDRLSIQLSLVFVVYLLTYAVTVGLTTFMTSIGVGDMLNSILWGFNFIIASVVAILVRIFFKQGTEKKFIKKQYQNNYLLNRISGFFFDVMIVCGIASIDVEDLHGLFVPFILMAALGGVLTWVWLTVVCKQVYKGYFYEGLLSMFGMLTGTIGSGVLLLREIDPNYETPAANNLVVGSSFGILFGAPMLILIGIAKAGLSKSLLTLGLVAAYLIILSAIIFFVKPKEQAGVPAEKIEE